MADAKAGARADAEHAAQMPTPEPPADEEPEASIIQGWQFIDAPPTADEVMLLLKSMPPVYGVKVEDYADHVQALPSSVKIGNVKHNAWTLYVSVAGRVRMVNDAAELNHWRVDFEPEPVTPTGVPGYLRADDQRIVYREYCTIAGLVDRASPTFVALGRKPGTAWVVGEGGSNAVSTNRYEKVETSARGRSLAAWGFGVLPGSGIASLEEMQGAAENARSNERGQRRGRGDTTPQRPRAEVLEAITTKAERVRQLRQMTDEAMTTRLAEYTKKNLGVDISVEGYTDGEGDEAKQVVTEIDLGRLKDGQLTLVENQLQQTLTTIEAEGANV